MNGDIEYIGALGSKRTQEKRLERLISHGLSKETLTKIHGPIGLNISSKTPEEISISILELTKYRRNKMNFHNILKIVLAAGNSKRFGSKNKLAKIGWKKRIRTYN